MMAARSVTPLARAGQAAEIASGVLYLASDASRSSPAAARIMAGNAPTGPGA